jgi:hypothetical protein
VLDRVRTIVQKARLCLTVTFKSRVPLQPLVDTFFNHPGHTTSVKVGDVGVEGEKAGMDVSVFVCFCRAFRRARDGGLEPHVVCIL